MSNPLMFVTTSLTRILHMAEIFGLARPQQVLTPTINHWMKLIVAGLDLEPKPLNAAVEMRTAFKLVKYKLDAYVSSLYGTPIPEPPWEFGTHDDAGVLIGGRFKVYTRRYILEGPRKYEFISTIKSIKKGLPRPPEVMLAQSKHDVVEKLTTEPPAYTAEEEEVKQQFIRQIHRTVNELFNKKRFKIREHTKAFFPSTSSTYNLTRSQLGALMEVATVIRDERLNTHEHLVKIQTKDRDDDVIMHEGDEARTVEYDATRLHERVGLLMSILKHKAMREVARVEPVALAEAMKVRVITKGPPMLYTYLKPLQRFLHKTLKQHPVFQLIGNRGISTDVLYSQGLEDPGRDEKLNSGDYNDATNELRSWVSEVIARSLAQRRNLDLSDDDRELFVKALVGHFFYGKKQKHGSLMGSIVNFPVLCIANATLCRWAMEHGTGKVLTMDEVQLLINGDDCLFPINEKGRDFWIHVGKIIGLNVNTSKSFWTNDFCNINSRDFKMTPHPSGDFIFTETPYINAGLLYGMKRSEAKTSVTDIVDKDKSLGSIARELIKSCPYEYRETVMKVFIAHHPELKETSLPWHMPEWAGGIGLPDMETVFHDIDDPEPWKNTRYGRDLSGLKYILLNWKTEHPQRMSDQAMIDVHNYAEDRLKQFSIKVTEKEGMRMVPRDTNIYDTLYGLLGCEWLFRHASTPEWLSSHQEEVNENAGTRKMRIIRHNEKLWNGVLNRSDLPRPDKRTWDMYKSNIHVTDFIEGFESDLLSSLQPHLMTVIENEEFFRRSQRLLWRER